MLGFGKRKRRTGPDGDTAEGGNILTSAEAELDSLEVKIEEKLIDIREESRDRKYKLGRAAKR